MSETAVRRVGFVGIGNMGWPMAANLVNAGFEVTVCDTAPGRTREFTTAVGGSAAADAASAAVGADALVTILPTSKHVAEVVAEVKTVLRTGAIVIDMSSGVPSVTRELADQLALLGVTMVDCPVSGGVPRARAGELTIMAAGPDKTLDRVEPLLKAMGNAVLHCGRTGNAQAMKALNNLVSAGGFLIGAEALLIGQKFGLDPAVMVDVLNASTGVNNSTQKKFKQFVLSRQFDSGFGLDLMVKDLAIALEVGHDTATPTPFSALCTAMWASAASLLGPGEDHTAVAKLVEKLGGGKLAAGGGAQAPSA